MPRLPDGRYHQALRPPQRRGHNIDWELLLETVKQLKAAGRPFCFLGYTYLCVRRSYVRSWIAGSILDYRTTSLSCTSAARRTREQRLIARRSMPAGTAFGVPGENIHDIIASRNNSASFTRTKAMASTRRQLTRKSWSATVPCRLPDGHTGLLELVPVAARLSRRGSAD